MLLVDSHLVDIRHNIPKKNAGINHNFELGYKKLVTTQKVVWNS